MTASASTMTPVEVVLDAATRAGRTYRTDSTGWLISCPGPRHKNGDRRPSLKLDEGSAGRALLYCHAGCETADILAALDLDEPALFPPNRPEVVVPIRRPRATEGPSRTVSPSTSCDLPSCARLREKDSSLGQCVAQYAYRDRSGQVVGQVHRYDPKSFRPFTLDGRGWRTGGRIPVPYRLPELSRDDLRAVVIVEGEKDADVLADYAHDVAVTCNAGGAGKWTDEHSQLLADAISTTPRPEPVGVFIVGDKDAAGQEHVRKVRASLAAVGIDAVVQWPRLGKDIAEHLANGGTFDDLDDDPGTSEPVTDRSSWAPVDLDPYLDGTHVPEVAALFPRTDGVCLLYAGRLHSFHGESESGKSLVLQAEASRLLIAGGRVLIVDFESDASTVIPRLQAMGTPPDAIRTRLRYVRPHEKPTRDELDELLAERYDLAVIDGLTDALGIFGSSSLDLDEVSSFMRGFPRRVAERTGAATAVIDHVTKAADTRGRFAVGSQAKMNALDGAAYVVEVEHPLGLGLRGVVSLRLGKDRPGTVRPSCGTWRKTDRTQLAARVIFDATEEGRTVVTVEPPTTRVGQDLDDGGPFRPTGIMEKVSRWLAGRTEPATVTDITAHVKGRREYVVQALEILTGEGYVTVTDGPRNRKLHELARPYVQADDPASDQYVQRT